MALYSLKEILADAQKRSYGVGYFNGFNLEMVRAYIRAAEDTRSPIIMGTAEGLLKYCDFDWLAPLMLHAARTAKVPVAVHLDHCYTFDNIMRALHVGFGSVMYDGSALSYEENVRNSVEVAKVCRPAGVGLECELGKVGGGEGDIENIYTDPEQAADFVEKTGTDFLAVSFGSTHGVYREAPRLDLNRLAAIRSKVDKPLVLHGGSGLSDDDFRNSIKGGVCKVNIYTDIVTAAINSIRKGQAEKDYCDLGLRAEDAMYEATVKKIRVFGSDNKY
ncbi:MAG: class II fructose-bisphosphate aldolase [Treponema sp.]|jgi:fructose-bisphosphate aldolase class II|nr:class II fructose-bisphosphate aldolase [Treponema sp.]